MDRTLIKVASAAARRAAPSPVEKLAPLLRSINATPTNASILPGSRAKARSKKPSACAMCSLVSPLCMRAMPWKYKSIASGCSERSARHASAAISWASSVLASRETISSCISNRSVMELSKRAGRIEPKATLRFSVGDEASSRGAFGWISDQFHRDARKQKAIAYVREWEGKFWITMDQNVKELTEKVENAVKLEMGGEIEKFKAGGQYDKRLSVDKKSELVARVRKVINADQLSELANVIEMLANIDHEGQQKTYYILIDRLDENWVDVSLRFKLIRGLVESLKAFRKIRDLKILVAVRSDVLERVVQETRDLTFQREKLDDYFVHIKWTKPLLRQLIDSRIQSLFRKQYTQAPIGFDDVFTNRVGNVDPFDYMVDRTLMRPRDMIAFVNECLNEAQGNYEVTATTIKRAETLFSTKRQGLARTGMAKRVSVHQATHELACQQEKIAS